MFRAIIVGQLMLNQSDCMPVVYLVCLVCVTLGGIAPEIPSGNRAFDTYSLCLAFDYSMPCANDRTYRMSDDDKA